jgi:hypothetical protein
MPKFRKKPVVIYATQCLKNGDHPEDGSDGDRKCEQCGDIMHIHGWIETLEGGHIVCPIYSNKRMKAYSNIRKLLINAFK